MVRVQQSKRLITLNELVLIEVGLNVNESKSLFEENDEHPCRDVKVRVPVLLDITLFAKGES